MQSMLTGGATIEPWNETNVGEAKKNAVSCPFLQGSCHLARHTAVSVPFVLHIDQKMYFRANWI
jgi:hypothetical protein